MARTKIWLTVIVLAAFALACRKGDTPTEPADNFIFHIKFGSVISGKADGRGSLGANTYGLTGTWTGAATYCVSPDMCCTGTSGTFDVQ